MSLGQKDMEVILSKVEGMLTPDEGRYLYKLARLNHGKGVIVEIGSWKGKSTIWLASGSMAAGGDKVYAIDPHTPLPEESYEEDTESVFRNNIEEAGINSHVVTMVMTSEEAVKGWNSPVGLLWIDGDHRYEQAKQDFLFWEPMSSRVEPLPCTTRSARRDQSGCCGKASFVPTGSRTSPSSTISRQPGR